MTDRELLELAAKAIDADVEFTSGAWTFGEKTECRLNGGDIWNPITDDGDALRLATMLKLSICICEKVVIVEQWIGAEQALVPLDLDPCAATRRAITRVAAEIGRAMP